MARQRASKHALGAKQADDASINPHLDDPTIPVSAALSRIATELGHGWDWSGIWLVEVFEADKGSETSDPESQRSRCPLLPATSLTATTAAPCTGHARAPASQFQYNALGNGGIVLDACTIRLHLADDHIPTSGTLRRVEELTSSTTTFAYLLVDPRARCDGHPTPLEYGIDTSSIRSSQSRESVRPLKLGGELKQYEERIQSMSLGIRPLYHKNILPECCHVKFIKDDIRLPCGQLLDVARRTPPFTRVRHRRYLHARLTSISRPPLCFVHSAPFA
ncbi:hypothetical protein CVT26_001307 [Gymnopilus dilepis]|uniref:Uncharacterized protein n=1 Tax=Gymnopilus dilepis TaxID=231916 RepID=A0A409Y1V0_9AGAR|nr:hypothetical protein CVT26_001307 [Gymnopilus dilepis]